MIQPPVSHYFQDFYFRDSNHTYMSRSHPKATFESATGVKGKYVPKFRRKYQIAWTVIKSKYVNRVCDYGGKVEFDHIKVNGNTIHYSKVWEIFPAECAAVANDWDMKSKNGLACGSAVHDYLEACCGRKLFPTPKKFSNSIQQANRYWKNELKTSDAVFREPEVVMGEIFWKTKEHEDQPQPFGFAGMADRLDYPPIPWTVDLIDYKTDDDVGNTTVFNNLLPPFDFLGDSKLEKYSVQVNFYADLIERNTPYKVRNIELVSISEDNYEKFILNRFSVIDLHIRQE